MWVSFKALDKYPKDTKIAFEIISKSSPSKGFICAPNWKDPVNHAINQGIIAVW